MTAPRISALIPAYNAASFVQASLDSVSQQTLADFIAIVSVDRSDDDTLAICQAHARRDRRFRVVEQPVRRGWVGNTNFLLRQVRTEFAVFAFHDDLLDPTYFAKLTEALQRNPEAAVAFSDTQLTRVNGGQEHWVYSELEGVSDPLVRATRILSQQGKWWVPNRGVFRQSMARKVGGLKTHDSGEFSADLPWLFHLSLYGGFVRVPETLCFKYYRPGSLSRSWRFGPRERFDVLASCIRELWCAEIPVEQKIRLSRPWLETMHANLAMRDATPTGGDGPARGGAGHA